MSTHHIDDRSLYSEYIMVWSRRIFCACLLAKLWVEVALATVTAFATYRALHKVHPVVNLRDADIFSVWLCLESKLIY